MKPIRTLWLAAWLPALILTACGTTGGGHSEIYGEIKSGYEISRTR